MRSVCNRFRHLAAFFPKIFGRGDSFPQYARKRDFREPDQARRKIQSQILLEVSGLQSIVKNKLTAITDCNISLSADIASSRISATGKAPVNLMS